MGGSLVARGENAGAFEGNIHAHVLMRQLGRVTHSCHLDRAETHVDRVTRNLHLMRKAAMHRVKPQQMGIGFDRAKIVDGDHFNVPAAGFDDGAQHIAADAAKTIDGNFNCHVDLLC